MLATAAAVHRDLPVACVRAPAPVPGARRAPGIAGQPRVLRLDAAQHRAPPAVPPVHPAAASLLDLVGLPLSQVAGAGGVESTNDIAPELLWEAFNSLAAPFTEFLATACVCRRRRWRQARLARR
ncbi:hypothetical protein ACP4OV_030594 [Aristida adscensionis]